MKRHDHVTTAVVAVLASTFTSACGSVHNRPDLSPQSREQTVVRVTNNHWLDVNVYVLRAGARHRLGTVTSFTTAKLRIPQTMVGLGTDIRLMVDAIGSRATYVSQPVHVDAGGSLDWLIQNNLQLSSLAVRY